jgi:carboxyl-terminal processing protease
MRQFGLGITNDPGAMKITIRKFYRASGSSTQLKGVVPDIILPSVNNSLEVGESALENPLPWDTIESAKYDKMNRVAPFLAELKRRSDTRVAVDRDFVFIREEIERYKQIQAEKSVSLNEAQRLKEKNEADARSKARKKDLASRPEPPGKLYEITLKNVNEPGLPPPTNHIKKADTSMRQGLQNPKFKTDSKKTKDNVGDQPVADPDKVKDADDEAEEDEVAPVDITLDETKRILADYVYLSLKQQALAGPINTKPSDIKE